VNGYGNDGSMEREEKKKPFPSLPTLPWKARKLASFPHSHSLGDDLEFLSSPSSFNFNFDEKCYPHAQYLLLLTCPFAQQSMSFYEPVKPFPLLSEFFRKL
jgi:hypothetical protein